MGGLRDFLPVHAWFIVLGLTAVAVLVFFVPVSVWRGLGLNDLEYIFVAAAIELAAAVGIAAVMIYYRAERRRGDDEWRFEP